MKTCLATLVAVFVLWVIDGQLFNGRYAHAANVVFNKTLSAILPR
jgi:hypothetical protein